MPPQPKPPSPSEAALADAQSLMQLWLRAKAFLAKATTEEPITREEEQVFLETKSEISKAQRTISTKLPPEVGFGADRMQEILRQSISISHLRNLPKADKNALSSNWHYVFIHLSRAMGALQFLAEGYTPPPRQAKQGSGIKDLKGAGSRPEVKKKNAFQKPGFWIALIIVGGIVYYVMTK